MPYQGSMLDRVLGVLSIATRPPCKRGIAKALGVEPNKTLDAAIQRGRRHGLIVGIGPSWRMRYRLPKGFDAQLECVVRRQVKAQRRNLKIARSTLTAARQQVAA